MFVTIRKRILPLSGLANLNIADTDGMDKMETRQSTRRMKLRH
jgi:hypothetical protein